MDGSPDEHESMGLIAQGNETLEIELPHQTKRKRSLLEEREMQELIEYFNEAFRLTKNDFKESWETTQLLIRNPK